MSKTHRQNTLHNPRDLNARALIFRNGDGAHIDRKKKDNRTACRRWNPKRERED